MIVIDASVGVKWFLNQTGWQAALDVLTNNFGTIAAPDLFGIEVSSALVREANMHKDIIPDMQGAIGQLASLIDSLAIEQFATTAEALKSAANLAIDLGHPLKDCLYLALAMELDCELVTCDARFAEKAKVVWNRVRVLGIIAS
jgi:predicted nucleic acid-binding protein